MMRLQFYATLQETIPEKQNTTTPKAILKGIQTLCKILAK